MNMMTGERRADHECPPILEARVRHLEFNDVRAGRLVATAAGEHLAKAREFGRGVLEGVRESAVTFAYGLSYRRDQASIRQIRWRTVDSELAGILLPRVVADVPDMAPDDDEAIVRWFSEQQAAALEIPRSVDETVDAEAVDDEVMLTLRNGSRSTRSWRGGGTMLRR